MIIVGAGGFASEILQILEEDNRMENIYFFDNINLLSKTILYKKYRIITEIEDVRNVLKSDNNTFALGIGNPLKRQKMYNLFKSLGGKCISTISSNAYIGKHTHISDGVNILSGVNISNNVIIETGSIVYYNSNITHDCKIGQFVEISPSVNVLGRVIIGDFSQIGSNSTILPNVIIGKNCVIGAGAVVTKNVEDNTTVVGIPARILK